MATMKALVKSKAEVGLWLEDVPIPKIGINDVMIQVLRTGICGTDLHIYNWDEWSRRTVPVGLVIGHEFTGRVVEVGSNVKDFHPGDIVSGEGHVVMIVATAIMTTRMTMILKSNNCNHSNI